MKIYVDLDHVDITEYTGIESGEYNTQKINFIFTPEYKDLVKVAIFGCKLDTDEPKFYKIYLSDDSCYLPQEVTSASDVISIGVYAFNVENGELKLRYSPTPVKTIVYEGSFREEAENSSSPTPTEIEQIMSRIISLEEITSDLNTRVETLENKACDLDSIKEDVETLKSDVENISGRLDTAESDIDELEGDIANTYSKTEVNTLLENKVDTTTFNSSQAAQDEKIAKAELILSQLPTVTGEGTNFSLSPTIEYDLEVGYKGDTTQNTLTGKNKLSPAEVFTNTTNGITYTSNGKGGYTVKGTSTGNADSNTYDIDDYTIQNGDYLHFFNTGNSFQSAFVMKCSDNSFISISFGNTNNRIVDLSNNAGKTISSIYFHTNSGNTLDVEFTPMICNLSSATSFEEYTGGIPSPNPNYPQDIQVVTGTQEITISNADNTESQTYTLHLGDEELAKIGDYQDKIYYDNGKWYKYGAIGKYILTGNETFVTTSTTTTRTYYGIDYSGSGIYQYSVQTDLPNFLCEKFTRRTQSGSFLPGQVSLQSTNKNVIYIFNRDTTEQQARTILTGMKSYFALATASTTEITNETLLSDLEYIRTHAKSYSGTTNISTSGNLPIIITASALKQLS